MPNIDKIVDFINDNLKATTLNRMAFQNSKYFGVAQSIAKFDKDKQTYEPVIYQDGKEISCFVDDTYDFQIYHKANSITLTSTTKQFGDGNNDVKETASMTAIVFANQERLKVTQEDLAFLVMAGLPSELKNSDLGNSNINNCIIVTQNANLNSVSVFQGEYQLTGYPLNPQSIYFAVNYQIEIYSNKNCLSCLNC
jgi:hypothetical protein